MCTLAAYVRMSPALPLLVAANRDEFLDRPTAEPGIIAVDPWVVAGQDLNAGGTWFGVNQHGLVVGLLNRRRTDGPDPSKRSRGLLCLEMLQARDPAAAVARLRAVAGAAYNP
ncbi:MAG: NRDE family protein, partial [Candidatus Binatia bacterium]